MSWANVAAQLADMSPTLADVLQQGATDIPLTRLSLAGKPGATCWGKTNAPNSLPCSLADADVEALMIALQVQGMIPVLEELEIKAQSGVGDVAAAAIAKLLADPECNLEVLDLSGCEIGGSGASTLFSALALNTSVATLRLSWNPLGREGGLALAEMLKTNRTISTLSICNTSLDTTAMVTLYSVIRDQPSLQSVDMQKALLYSRQEDTTKHAAQMLQHNLNIVALNLGTSMVGDLGAEQLSKVLRRNKTLRSLVLSSNQIGITGGEALASLLIEGSSLSELDLSANRIGDDGGAAFGLAISRNTTLRKLNLCSNSMGDVGLTAVAEGMMSNSTIVELRLWGNNFTDGGSAVNDFDKLCNGRFDHLDVVVDFKTYTVDDVIKIAYN